VNQPARLDSGAATPEKFEHVVRRASPMWLVVVPAVIMHFVLPVQFAIAVWRSASTGVGHWLPAAYLAAAYGAFIYLAGAWSWFGSAARYLIAIATVAVIAVSAPRSLRGPSAGPDPIDAIVRVGLGTLVLVGTIRAIRGRRDGGSGLDLAFPLRGGTYIVGQGGSTTALNHHGDHPSQARALDILKLNGAGVRASGLYPAELQRYAIYDAEVVSPCDGVVVWADDGLPDLPPPDLDPTHPAGNCLAIETETATVFLAHLKRGSVLVKAGDQVSKGQSLARVGNSGNTTEPHLHIHAEAGKCAGRINAAAAVPLRFDGRFLARNDRVTNT
jgi:hypothetical protein